MANGDRRGLRRRDRTDQPNRRRTQGSLNPTPATPEERRQAGSLRQPAGFEQVNIRNQLQSNNLFQRGLRQGISTVAATPAAVGSIAAGVAGFDKTSRDLADSAAETQEQGQKFSQLPSFSDVQEGDASLGGFTAGLLGSQVPVLASLFGTGGVGGIIGRGAATAGLKQAGRTAAQGTAKLAAKREAAKKAVDATRAAGGKVSRSQAGQLGQATTRFNNAKKNLDKLRVKQAAQGRRGQNIGAGTGAFGASFGLQSGEAIDILTDDESGSSQQQRALAALGGAAVTGGLEFLPVMRLFNKVGLTRPAKKIIREELTKTQALGGIARGAGSQAGIEAFTEVAQGAGIKAAHRLVNENIELFDDASLEQYFEEGIAGAIIGGLLGGAASVRIPTAGPTETETEDRIADSQLEQKKAAAQQLGDVRITGRAREERLDRAQTSEIGSVALESAGFPDTGDSEFRQARLEVGELLRAIVDPDVEPEQAERATQLLSERYGIEPEGEVFQQALLTMRDTEALQVDRIADFLETQREGEERAQMEEEFRLRQQRLEEIQGLVEEEATEDQQVGEEDLAGGRQQFDDEGNALTTPAGEALEETQPAVRAAFAPERDAPSAESSSSRFINAPLVGRLFVSERSGNLRDDSVTDEAQTVTQRLNQETGSSGQFQTAPAGDSLIRIARARAGLDDSTTSTNNANVQREVLDAATDTIANEKRTKIFNKRLPDFSEATQRVIDLKRERTAANEELAKAKEGAETDTARAEVDRLNTEVRQALGQLPAQEFTKATEFLNQFDTVVEEQIPGAVVGRDPQRLTTAELRQNNIIREPRRENEALQSKEIQVQDQQGNPAVLDLVALTQTMIGRVEKAGRGGAAETRERSGQEFEQQGGSGTVSDENIARAVSAGLGEVFTRNGFLPAPGDPEATQQLQQLVQQRNQLEQEIANPDTTRDRRLAAGLEQIRLDSRIAANPIVNSALPDNPTVFQTRGGKRTTSLGKASRRGAAAKQAEIARMTSLDDIQAQITEAEAIVNEGKGKEKVAAQRERLKSLREQERAVQSIRGVLGEVTDGVAPKRLAKLLDETAAALLNKEGDAADLVEEALGRPESKIRQLRTERVRLTSQVDERPAPTIPNVPDKKAAKQVAKVQKLVNAAASMAQKNGGTAKFIGDGRRGSIQRLTAAVFGPRANAGAYNASDVAVFSIEGVFPSSRGFSEAARNELAQALSSGATVVMEDNFAPSVSKQIKEIAGQRTKAEKEFAAAQKERRTAETLQAKGKPLLEAQRVEKQIEEVEKNKRFAETQVETIENRKNTPENRDLFERQKAKVGRLEAELRELGNELQRLRGKNVRQLAARVKKAVLREKTVQTELNELDKQRDKLINQFKDDFAANNSFAAQFMRDNGYAGKRQGDVVVWRRKDGTTMPQPEPTAAPKQEVAPTGTASVELPQRSRFAKKDQAKVDKSVELAKKNGGRNLFIGRGSGNSSTNAYREAFGNRANVGVYTNNDVVFVSAEGSRGGRVKPNLAELGRAADVGATFITDKAGSENQAGTRSSSFNVGEKEVAEFLQSRGYQETNGNGVWKLADQKASDTTLQYIQTRRDLSDSNAQAKLVEARAANIANEKRQLPLDFQIRSTLPLPPESAARLEREITTLVDQFSAMFGTPPPNILLANTDAASRGSYNPEEHRVILNINKVEFEGALPIEAQFTLLHEMAHGLEYETLLNLPAAQFNAVAKEYSNWRDNAKKRLDEASDRQQELNRIFFEKKGPLGVTKQDLDSIGSVTAQEEYVLDPREWFADNAARLLMESSFTPSSDPLVMDALKKMAGLLKRIFTQLVKHRAFSQQRDTPALRNFLINVRTKSTTSSEPLESKMGEPQLDEATKKRLEAIDRSEQFWLERQKRAQDLFSQLREAGRIGLAKRLQAQVQALNTFLDLQQQLRNERRAAERSPEQILAQILREDVNNERQRPDVQQGESVVDNPGATTVADPTEFGAPPWISRQQGNERDVAVPSMNQRVQESNRLALELEDAGQQADVRVADWAEISTEMNLDAAKLEEVSGLGTIVDNKRTGRPELVVWANESMNLTDSARRNTLTSETARLTTMLRLRELSKADAKQLWGAFLKSEDGQNIEDERVIAKQPAQLDKFIEGRSNDPSGQLTNIGPRRNFVEFIAGEVDKPTTKFGRELAPIVRALTKNVTNQPGAFLSRISSVADRTGSVSKFGETTWKNAPFNPANPETQKAFRILGEVTGQTKKTSKKKTTTKKKTSKKAVSKKTVTKKASKKKASKKKTTASGGNQPPLQPPRTPPTPPSDDDPSPRDAFNSFHVVNGPFSIEAFHATRDLMISRFTAEERRTLGKALNAQPVRAQIIKFLRDNGALTQGFMDDQFSVLALGHLLYTAGELNVEASASSSMNKLNAFVHKTAGTLRTSEQAIELMTALNDSAIELRRSKLMEAAKEGSNLAEGKYALSIADLHELLDVLTGAKLFDNKTRGKATQEQIERALTQNPNLRDLSQARRKRLAEDVKNGVFTKKMLKELLQNENDFTVNPEEQFVLRKIFSSEKVLQRAAQSFAQGLQWFGRHFELWIGEAMRARFTGNQPILDFANSVYTDVTSQGRGEAMFARKMRRGAEFHGEYLEATRNLSDEQQAALRDHMLGRKESTDPDVLKARQDIAQLMKKLRRYAIEADLPLGDLGQNYVPWVFDPVRVSNRFEELAEDWARKRFDDDWTNLARERGIIKKDEKLSEVAKRELIRKTLNGIATENNGLVDTGDTSELSVDKVPPKVGAMFKRDLAFIERKGDTKSKELLGEMFSDEINATVATYIDQLVKRVEYTRTFGKNGEKFLRARRKAREFGADAKDIELMDKMANSVLGRTGLEVSPFWKALMAPVENVFQRPVMAEDGNPFKTAKDAAKVKREKQVKGRIIENPDGAGFIIDRAITNDPRRFRQTNALFVTYQNFTILGLAAFTNTADAAGILFRTGSINIAFRSYVDLAKETINSIRTARLPDKERQAQMTDLRKLATDLGIVEFSVTSDILGQTYGGNMMDGRAKRWNDKFFRWNGMEHLTRTMRLGAFAAGKRFLTSAARRAAAGDEAAIRELAEVDLEFTDLSFDADGEIELMSRGEADALLEPLGLTVAGARDRELSQANFDALTDAREIERQRIIRRVARDDRAKQALNRMVDESVLRPSPTQRPTWMNNPNWMLFSHLKGFMFTYHERVLRKAYTSAAQGRYGPMMAMSSYVGMIMAMDALRAVVQHGPKDDDEPWRPELTFAQRLEDAGRRSGVYGSFGFIADMQEAAEFNSNLLAEAGGPTTSQINRLWRAFVSGRTSMGSAVKRSIPGSQVFVDVPQSALDWTQYYYDQSGLLSPENPLSQLAFEETPVVGEAIQQNAHRLRLRQ